MILQGLIPPIITPLLGDHSLDRDSLVLQARAVVDGGAEGLWLNGTTGEFHAFSTQQMVDVVGEVVRSLDGRVPVIAQVGAPATALAVERAVAALEAGATAVAAVTPFYLEYAPDELADYYRSIRAAVALPLLVYQVPAMTKVTLDVDMVVELAREGTIIGIKDSSGTASWLRRLIERANVDGVHIRTFTGAGGLISATMLAGASGAMCAIANLVPAHCAALVAAAQSGNHAMTHRLQGDIWRLERALGLDVLPRWTPTVSIFKAVLQMRGLIATDACAPPGRTLDRARKAQVSKIALPMIEKMEEAAKGQFRAPRHATS